MENVRSPMDNLFNMLSGFSAGQEKALKQGIYNAVALFFLCLVSAAGYGLYIILSPFIKPLIWALLCGAVLFPFKCSLVTAVQSWFAKVEASRTLLIVNASLLPVHIFDNVSERVGSFLWTRIKYIVWVVSLTLLAVGVYHYTPNMITCLAWRMFQIFTIVSGFFILTCNVFTVSTILVGYLTVLYIYWTPSNSASFRYMSFVIWFIISMYLSSIAGAYRVLVFIALQTLCAIGFIYEVMLIMDGHELNGRHLTFSQAARFALTNDLFSSPQEDHKSASSEDDEQTNDCVPEGKSVDTPVRSREEAGRSASADAMDIGRIRAPKLGVKSISLNTDADLSSAAGVATYKSVYNMHSATRATLRDRYLLGKIRAELRTSLDMQDNKVDTDKYMYGALYACAGMLLWKHKWIAHILVIPLVYYIVKQFGSYFGFWEMILKYCDSVIQTLKSWCMERHQALIPSNIRGLYKVSIIVDGKLRNILKGSVNAVATTSVILGLIVFTTCASIFITIQIYAEGLHLVQVTGEILNSTLMNNPDIDWVPEKWEESVNSVLDNAYTYGRSAISDGIRGLVKDLEPAKAEQMEKKVLELWDRLYQAWMMSNTDPHLVGPTVDAMSAYSAWESFKDSFGKTPLHLFNMTSIQNFAKENIGVLMSVLDSVWSIVKGNMSVILTVFTELFYIVLMSGSAVLNFVLSTVVFFTTLFYLLSSSGKTYKPIELTTMFSPISCHRFAVALQEAVIGVFAATFKLASFFGMWTWFIHNLFQVKIVYLPSALATMLGAVPFLDAYFACIPATIELWFTRGSMTAITFFLFHFLPCNIVVTEFYKEIKGGGHPYLTGLSIAGGIFCLGVEGAIFGPLLLCCIMVVINLSRRYLHSPEEEEVVLPSYSNHERTSQYEPK
ncbi:PREDICTED: transmembrane protein 245 isoform X2 [Wasmannia auropunctata]|uniref:transmembrane protein 245 isoform X2 n=1 Tax=Wasmannia auropunctata TaxID=64793 RepID=UPI0005EE4A92|nr:PREDICTED: transmembrane protein 245 isoform X2 [Wasmannia auropunctata]